MKTRIFPIMLLIFIVFYNFIILEANAEASSMTDEEAMNRAIQYGNDNDYKKGAEVLENFLTTNPNSKNEDIYNKLAEFYDNEMMDYEDAVKLYQKYLTVFINGRFNDIYSKRLQYLQKNRAEWDILREYNKILSTYNTRSQGENIKLMEGFLRRYPNSFLVSDVYNWLALQYFQVSSYDFSISYIEKYFNSISENLKNEPQQAANYVIYAEALSKLRRFNEAKDILSKHVNINDPGIRFQYSEGIGWVLKEQRIWYGYLAVLFFLMLVVVYLIILKIWREKDWFVSLKSMIPWAILTVIASIGCMAAVLVIKHLFFKLFIYLAIGQILALILIKLFGMVSYRIKKPVYYIFCFLIIVAFLYLPFYFCDNLSIFWTPIEFV